MVPAWQTRGTHSWYGFQRGLPRHGFSLDRRKRNGELWGWRRNREGPTSGIDPAAYQQLPEPACQKWEDALMPLGLEKKSLQRWSSWYVRRRGHTRKYHFTFLGGRPIEHAHGEQGASIYTLHCIHVRICKNVQMK